MDYEPYKVSYTAGQAYVGATVAMYPAPDSHGGMGNFIAWDAAKGEIVWSKPEQFSVWSGALATDGDVIFYGTLEGYIKAVDNEGNELYKFKTPSGIIGNINTFEHNGKQYVAVLSGVGGWAGIGLAGGLLAPDLAAAGRPGSRAGGRGDAGRHRGSGCGRRLCRACRLHDAGRTAHRLWSPRLILSGTTARRGL
jgi:glucose dehydrogenase